MERKQSFVVIDIMENLSPDQMLKNAIKIINQQESFFTYILNSYYWLFIAIMSLINLKFIIYCKQFDIFDIVIKHGEEAHLVTNKQKLIIFDHGIKIFDYLIPYEIIHVVSYNEGSINITFFGRVDFKVSTAKIYLSTLQTTVSFKLTEPLNIYNLLKSNMYYHIKYNSFNKDNLLLFKVI